MLRQELAVQLTTVFVSLFHVEASAEAQFYVHNRKQKLPAFLARHINKQETLRDLK